MIEIYITTNLINGKIYIGQCYAGKRWYLGSGVYLKNAVKLYGKENFKREILLIVGNEYANWFETAFIEGYNSVNKNIGYNIAKQASTVRGIHFKHSKKTWDIADVKHHFEYDKQKFNQFVPGIDHEKISSLVDFPHCGGANPFKATYLFAEDAKKKEESLLIYCIRLKVRLSLYT